METKKNKLKRAKRVTITFLCCFPLFLVLTTLLSGANPIVQIAVNLLFGVLLIFIVEIIADKREAKRKLLHEKYQQEKKNNQKLAQQQKQSVQKTQDLENQENLNSKQNQSKSNSNIKGKNLRNKHKHN